MATKNKTKEENEKGKKKERDPSTGRELQLNTS